MNITYSHWFQAIHDSCGQCYTATNLLTVDDISITSVICVISPINTNWIEIKKFFLYLLSVKGSNMGKGMIKILKQSVVTQTVLGGLITYLPVANFLQCINVPKIMTVCWPQIDTVTSTVIIQKNINSK